MNNSASSTKTREQPHLYWKDIECIVKDCDYKYWYASGTHFKANITVYSDEYDLTQTFDLNGYDAKTCESLSKGDIVTCELYSWVMDSTGEVIRREINRLK